ncbi:MAG TPA: methylmalonyl Co-A mutase-associated GTPase MeaB, partial [Kouleothrix sp.]|nr:methylmalonyl Co-A mutase-associated GTPase MeaB [Kouleothrix sp.]HRC75819.1 methylmalonyl Co-A mutase-associated GTPase MeaB [Kouleothrix sp.]
CCSSIGESSTNSRTGRAHIVGVTGSPGAGKSTLVNALALHWRRAGKTVGIIAVDPTSPFTGGAILGDRIRMQPLGGDPGIFIRSMASRGRLGGIAHATSDAIDLLDAAGFDMVLVETVGAGQSEVEIASAAHTTMVIEVPGMGDDVQAIKAGILEIADIFVVNKADREGADATVHQLRAMLRLGGPPRDGWEPPIVPAVAMREEGIAQVAAQVERHLAHLTDTGQKLARERQRVAREFELIVQEAALERVRARLAGGWDALLTRLAEREIDPFSAAGELLA